MTLPDSVLRSPRCQRLVGHLIETLHSCDFPAAKWIPALDPERGGAWFCAEHAAEVELERVSDSTSDD